MLARALRRNGVTQTLLGRRVKWGGHAGKASGRRLYRRGARCIPGHPCRGPGSGRSHETRTRASVGCGCGADDPRVLRPRGGPGKRVLARARLDEP